MNFAVVVDIGSTGSRTHVFEYYYDPNGCSHTGAAHLKLPEKSSKIRPGFSTFLDTKLKESSATNKKLVISEYLQLIKREMDVVVPKHQRRTTPVWLLGTAGMRNFDSNELSEILGIMRTIVLNQWKDYKTHPDWIDVLDGEREGLFSWVLLNQLLGRKLNAEFSDILITPAPVNKLEGLPVALAELGGASAQVVASPPEFLLSKLPNPAHFTRAREGSVHLLPNHPGFVILDFCGKSSIVYAKSFQGFGRQLALQRYLTFHHNLNTVKAELPCLPNDIIFPDLSDQTGSIVPMEDIGVIDDGTIKEGSRGMPNGTFNLCKKAVDDCIFRSHGNTTASLVPIPFKIDESIDIIGTENFYHFHKMVSSPDPSRPTMFSIDSLHQRAEELCQLTESGNVAKKLNPKAEFEKATTACFGLTYLAGFLEYILLLPKDRSVTALRRVNNIEVAWAAGHILLEIPHLIHRYPELAIINSKHDEL